MDTLFWQKLLQLGIFCVFVSSIIEVVKGISAVGFIGLIKQLWNTLIHNGKIDTGAVQSLSFAIALFVCWAFGYGVMRNLLNIQNISEIAAWTDYFGTASLVYQGAGAVYDKFSSLQASWKKAQETTQTQTDVAVHTETQTTT